MRPKFALAAILPFLLVQAASAQYYYKDILSIRESVQQQQLYSQNQVRSVQIQSFDPDGTENKDFLCHQTVSADYTLLETESGSIATGKSTLETTFSPDPDHSKVLRAEDSSRDAVTTTLYTYDAQGNVFSITSMSRTADTSTTDTTNFNSTEARLWYYNAGHPDHMLRIKNNTDTTLVRFQLDDKGDISDEVSVRNGVTAEHYYYYYDDNHHLTDIVRYNVRLKKMFPDYIFEYDATTGKLSKMTVVQAINSSYLVWYYEYNPGGLRVKQFCYDKTKELIGTIGYTYK